MFHAVGLCIKLDFDEFFAIAAIVFQEFHAYPSCALLEDRQSNQARTASEEIHPRNISTHPTRIGLCFLQQLSLSFTIKQRPPVVTWYLKAVWGFLLWIHDVICHITNQESALSRKCQTWFTGYVSYFSSLVWGIGVGVSIKIGIGDEDHQHNMCGE